MSKEKIGFVAIIAVGALLCLTITNKGVEPSKEHLEQVAEYRMKLDLVKVQQGDLIEARGGELMLVNGVSGDNVIIAQQGTTAWGRVTVDDLKGDIVRIIKINDPNHHAAILHYFFKSYPSEP